MAKRPNMSFKNNNNNNNSNINNINRNKKRIIKRIGDKPTAIIQKKKQRPVVMVKSKKLVQDARNKLIEKKRSQVVDARDVLAEIAKKHDARDKLNKIRERRSNNGNKTINTINSNNKTKVKVIGNHILQKTDRNGKISLTTNKTKPTATMNVAIKKQLGLIQQSGKKPIMKRTPITTTTTVRQPSQTLRQAVLNEIDYAKSFDGNLYKWTSTPNTTASKLISSLERQQRIIKNDHYQDWNSPLIINNGKSQRQQYYDMEDLMMEDEEMPMATSLPLPPPPPPPPHIPIKQTISLQGSSRNSNIHMRLDNNNRIEPETHGILGHHQSMITPKTKVVVPAGHRIVVSNLQSTVTQDDVKELFEDIGQLLAARLVRPGIAEVIYKNLKDAQKAVDTYHNRQLDGQPMKCLLVNKRPLNNPTAPPITKMETHGILSNDSTTISNKLVPDLSTIHKVLFQRK